MKKNRARTYGYGPEMHQDWMNFIDNLESFQPESNSYDFLRDYSNVHNIYPACTIQPNPMSNKVMFIIDALNKMGVKYTVDVFNYDGSKIMWGINGYSAHKLVNIIVEPNPEATGAAIVFCAHHDVANVHSQNCQDNGASVCNLLKLTSLIKDSKEDLHRTIILFSDCEEFGARGANKFASDSKRDNKDTSIIKHNTYREISSVINLELTGKGKILWSDCQLNNLKEEELHSSLEQKLGQKIHKFKTPPNDAIAFRKHGFPALCIGILPENDLEEKNTWRICHSVKDSIDGCDSKDMEDFTNFLFTLTEKTNTPQENLT